MGQSGGFRLLTSNWAPRRPTTGKFECHGGKSDYKYKEHYSGWFSTRKSQTWSVSLAWAWIPILWNLGELAQHLWIFGCSSLGITVFNCGSFVLPLSLNRFTYHCCRLLLGKNMKNMVWGRITTGGGQCCRWRSWRAQNAASFPPAWRWTSQPAPAVPLRTGWSWAAAKASKAGCNCGEGFHYLNGLLCSCKALELVSLHIVDQVGIPSASGWSPCATRSEGKTWLTFWSQGHS